MRHTAGKVIFFLLLIGCSKNTYNYKVVPGVGYVPYSKRANTEMSKDILSTGDTLCALHKEPFSLFWISPKGDTTYIYK